MDRKTGILTFHRSRNYGAVLQAYALMNVLRKNQVQTEIIDYKCAEIENKLHLWNGLSNGIIYALKQFGFRFIKKIAFDRWIKKNLFLSQSKNIDRNGISNVCNLYHTVIVGSDQVFNISITGKNEAYMLADKELCCRKVAYSASVGDNIVLSEEQINQISEFASVSVREKSLGDFLQGRDIETSICCDPCVFLERDDLEKLSKRRLYKKRLISRGLLNEHSLDDKFKYVFLFMIEDSAKLRKIAEDYARHHGFLLVSNKGDFRFLMNCSPEDFLSWIRYADCIFTNSFHGTLFSIRFHKKFYTDIRKQNESRNERAWNLLNKLNLLDCVLDVEAYGEELEFKKASFSDADRLLEEEKNKSLKWLLENI